MRFSVTDLLVVTTLVAAYAAGFSFLARLQSDRPFAFEAVSTSIMVVSMAGTTLLMARRGRKKLGAPLARWTIAKWWLQHLVIFTLFLGYLVLSAWRGRSGGSIFPLMIALQQFLFLANRWFVLGENGVLLGMAFVPWEDCRLRLDEASQRIDYAQTARLWPPRVRLKGHRITVPEDRLDEVRAILAEKQPTAEDQP